MKLITRISLVLLLSFAVFAFTKKQTAKYKCMIQLKNYDGEGAYIIVSLLDTEGKYLETLQVLGDDDEWYHEISEWWDFYGKRRPDIDAVTGATISGGQRAIKVVEIPTDKIDTGYKIRFETAVEDQEYYADDVQFELTSENVKSKFEGKGFIRYVRMMPQK